MSAGEQNTQTGEMSFWDHLETLRWALFRVIIVLFVLLVGCFIAMPHIFDPFVLGPTDSGFFRLSGFPETRFADSVRP